MITAVLTKYKREHLFSEQLQSVVDQSVNVNEILICDNRKDNKGVWERFKLAKKSKNDFVWILDDDTMPGKDYLKNVLDCFEKNEGLYGTCGYIFNSNKKYENNYIRIGWPNPNEELRKVDYVVHNWFFKKEWLQYFWNVEKIPFNYGEDMNFSFQLQKHNIETFVPPHPINEPQKWGSTKGSEYGDDDVSLWVSNPQNFKSNMFDYFKFLVNKGWKLINSKII